MTLPQSQQSDSRCVRMTEDDLAMMRCPKGQMCDCYWCPLCQEPHEGFIACAPHTCSACGESPPDGTPCGCFSTAATTGMERNR